MQGLSIIVPLLNEIDTLPTLVANLELLETEQLIIVDGGSTDGGWQWLIEHWHNPDKAQSDDPNGRVLLQSEAGRAQQMNLGAEYAAHAMLLFLHADSQLPSNARSLICKGSSKERWGRFDVRFNSSLSAMALIAFSMNARSRISGVATGDQAIFIHRALFDQVNGFDELSLMEDIAISKKLRAIAKPHCFSQKVVTSARRWEQNGLVQTVLKMWWFRLLFFFGVSPDKFVNEYRNVR